MPDQIETILLQIAEARRIHGVNERDGTVHEVYRKDGEQKVRVNIGFRPDGSPWLTPWLKVENHHGSARTQRKWHKGMNVKVSTVGADMLKATVKPHGENKKHKEPDHADDINETEQYAKHRSRKGPDFAEHWLADSSNSQGNQSGKLGTDTGGGGFGGGGASGSFEDKDPDKHAVVLTRAGAKPQQEQDKNEPWEGPPPDAGSSQKRHMTYAGKAGNVPTQNGDAVVTQFDKHVKTEHTQDHVLQKVQSSDGQQMPIPDSKDAGSAMQVTIQHLVDGTLTHLIHNTALNKIMSAIHTNGTITHTIQDMQGNISTFVQQAEQMIHQVKGQEGTSTTTQNSRQILHQVGNSVLQILKDEININSSSVNVNSAGGQGGNQSPITPDALNGNDTLPVQGIMWPIAADLSVEAVNRGPILWAGSARLVAEVIKHMPTLWPISVRFSVSVNKQ